MKALLFPGQGVQKVGMLNSHFEEVSEVKSMIDEVSKSLDFDLAENNKIIADYSERIFDREAFQDSLTETEKELF